ncbi:sensor histidine kinase [Polluticoccus soli]|uniref:sensor histidine kinase n=1 Tax=Polluticoccus soli TaxID=3034150 RepID=UPI0023E0C2B5|nr:ATP-binding protein [Flavipsychrobacter sp. JY13-12]
MNPETTLLVFILGSLLLTLFAFFLIIYVTIQKRKQYRHSLEKQRMEHKYASQLLQSQIEVQEQALKNFSEEIHDNVGQVLSLTKMQLYRIAETATDELIRNNAQKSTELLTKAISDLRSLSHTANGGLISNIGLVESIRKEMGYISSAKNINCTFDVKGDPYPLGSEKDLLVFRIIQESIANALKHANPRSMNIRLVYEPDSFHVSVIDDGKGFDTTAVTNNGLGLNNIKLRTDLLKGKLDILSSKEAGTTVSLEMPVLV